MLPDFKGRSNQTQIGLLEPPPTKVELIHNNNDRTRIERFDNNESSLLVLLPQKFFAKNLRAVNAYHLTVSMEPLWVLEGTALRPIGYAVLILAN